MSAPANTARRGGIRDLPEGWAPDYSQPDRFWPSWDEVLAALRRWGRRVWAWYVEARNAP